MNPGYTDIGLEEAVLGILLRYPERIHDCGVEERHFWREDHKRIIRAFLDKGVALSVAASAIFGDEVRAMELAEAAFSDAGLEQHLTYLSNLDDKRKVKELLDSLSAGFDEVDHAEVAETVTDAASKLLGAISGSDDCDSYGTDCYRDATAEGGEMLETFFPFLPVRRRELIGVAARPGCGKTAMAHSMGEWFTTTQEGCFAVFTMEVSRKEWFQRTISKMCGRPIPQYLADGKTPSTRYLEEAARAAKSYESRPGTLFVSDKAGMTVAAIRSKCLGLQAKHGRLSGVAIDQLSNIRKLREKGMNEATAIKNTTEAIKQLARELDCPIFLLSQFNRDPSGDDGWYTERDIFGSDGLFQDCDQLWLLQNPPGSDASGGIRPVNLRRVKWRNGPKGEFDLEFDAPGMTFRRTL